MSMRESRLRLAGVVKEWSIDRAILGFVREPLGERR